MVEVPGTRWKNLGPRLLTAIVLVLICIAPFYIGGFVWALLVALIAVRIMYEWMRMTDPDAGLIGQSIAMIGLVVSLVYAVQGLPVWAIAALCVATFFAVAERLPRGGTGWTAIGLPYVILPAVLLILLRGSDVGFDTRGFTQLIFIIVIVIAADVGAYFGGSSIGGPKLAPKLSPNKTWSGVVCGLIFASVVAVIAGLFIGLPISLSVLLAVPIVVFSVVGDLLESTVKRRVGIKDTGTLLPGHGGLLDRLDSLMLAVVGGALLFMLIGDSWPIA
ncbi:phosphatidate cytidylyltransferase [Algimonas porphyrae]|uniref:Phosphatidate cytidylyltransferase n=1 Tax=Algimonas porphyrae TaxID=1128113 RepID=A0ABQ5UZU9_9PROT|nr:phosphatidate cytidylyltransferase [Algimonas porphyrae]GLQ20290.1 phosphatidate cytidylyltransferase [Algimonas porphyrae]